MSSGAGSYLSRGRECYQGCDFAGSICRAVVSGGRWAVAIIGILSFCFSGCQPTVPADGFSAGRSLESPEGLADYLRQQRLPGLEAVQIWQNDYAAGLKLSTAHYDIYTTETDPLILRQIPGFVESAYRAYNMQLPQPIETQTRLVMYLFGRRGQWEDFTRVFSPSEASILSKIKAGAYYANGACVAYDIGRQRTFSVLGHEGWHQFNSRHFAFRLPSWLDEGIAMLFEAGRYEGGLFIFEPGQNLYRLGALKKTLAENKMIPLARLIGMNPGEALTADESDSARAFYAQSYALVRFLREEDYGRRLYRYQDMLLDGLRGDWQFSEAESKIASNRNIPMTVPWNRAVGRRLFIDYIGEDLDQIEKEYTTFCKKIVYPVRFR